VIGITETSEEVMAILERYGVGHVVDELPNQTSGAIIEKGGDSIYMVKFDHGNDTPEYIALLLEEPNMADKVSAQEWFFHYVDVVSLRIIGDSNEHLAA